ncbi:UNVERIFIED_CONTAM: Inositol oxygenase 1 [Sesamum calycinum]|uniref:Inositol oxygenase n=1 Tax=Sesamum calycinum TaxID=2727403 RepID=A0AAW2NG64_9LAMI
MIVDLMRVILIWTNLKSSTCFRQPKPSDKTILTRIGFHLTPPHSFHHSPTNMPQTLMNISNIDLGKVLHHPKFGELPQWAVVGDTFPVGCAFDESIYFKENPDHNNPAYNTKFGVYKEGCGLDNVLMSWGHDDYMYLVAKENKSTLPSAGLFVIRYHSFYALHRAGAYKYLMNKEDEENMKWLKIFNKYDLYSKSKVRIDVEKSEAVLLLPHSQESDHHKAAKCTCNCCTPHVPPCCYCPARVCPDQLKN